MKLLACSIVLALFVGCGSDVSGGVSLADAREECSLFQLLATGTNASESILDAFFINAESLRDDGFSKSAYLASLNARCLDINVAPTAAALDQCIICIADVAAVVWP